MADINLLDLQPHQVSRDLRGYSVFLYGDPKSGKTTIASQFPDALILGFEKGWSALPGVMAQPMNSWSDFRKVLRQLKDPQVKERFSTIVVDTADIAYDLCEAYICANAKRADGGFGVDAVGDIPFGKGYTLVAKEYDECLRAIVQMDYGLVIISHATDKTFKNEQGQEYNQIVPTLSSKPRNIVSRLCDIIGYSRIVKDPKTGDESTKLFMRGTDRFVAGSRFKYTPDYIDFTYDHLVEAICNAIEQQSAEMGGKFITDERQNVHLDMTPELNFDLLVKEFNSIVDEIIEKVNNDEQFQSFWAPRITQITDKYLGKGVKVNQCSREQVEVLDLILIDLKELVEKEM